MRNFVLKQFILFVVCGLLAGQEAFADSLRERPYLQTDKRFYLSGELVWMKLLVSDAAGGLSDVSKVGYVELLNDTSAVVQARIVLEKGVGEGCLSLPTDLPTGNYRLVAYTRYMRNEGEAVFYEKLISVVNTFVVNEELKTDSLLPRYSFTKQENRVSLSSDRTEYNTRSGGEVRIKGLPSNMRTLSLSIAGMDIYSPSGENGIATWKEWVASVGLPSMTGHLLAEYEGPILSGKMIDLSTGEPSSKEAVKPLLGVPGNGIRLFGGQLGQDGEVTFFTKHISGAHEIVTTALSPSKTRYRVDIESPYATHPEKELPALRLNPDWQDELVKRSVGLQVLHAYVSDSLAREKEDKPWFQWQPDWSYLLDEYTRFTTMEEVVIEFIPGLRFRKIDGTRRLSVLTEERVGYTVGNSLILLDGIPITDHEVIFKYNPLNIRRIDVYKGKYVFGDQIFDGIASFSSYENNYPGLVVDNSTQFFDYEGTQAQRIFYMPSYDTEVRRRSPVPDYRHTLLWMPEVQTGGESSLSIPFTTSDLTGTFTITVEGLTENGDVVYATEQFEVK